MHIELASRAIKDLGSVDRDTRRRIRTGLEQLENEGDNLDIAALSGRSPWRRLRVGEHRIIFRPFTTSEAASLNVERGYLIARIVNRRDLHRAVANLPEP